MNDILVTLQQKLFALQEQWDQGIATLKHIQETTAWKEALQKTDLSVILEITRLKAQITSIENASHESQNASHESQRLHIKSEPTTCRF